MKTKLEPPALFPCANRVKMPHVGADELPVERTPSVSLNRPALKPLPIPAAVSDGFVRHISKGLSFSEDVVRERCFHTLPYDTRYFYEALDVSDLISAPQRHKTVFGRHDTRGTDRRHMPCHISRKEKLKPLKKKRIEKALQMHKEAAINETRSLQSSLDSLGQRNAAFLTEPPADDTGSSQTSGRQMAKREWDEYLISLLSENTAQWIVKQRMSPSEPRQEKLKRMLQEYYGDPPESSELVPDTVSESDFPQHEEEVRLSKWKTTGQSLLDKVRQIEKSHGQQTDPYGDETDAAFYRLPAGFRRAKKQQEREEAELGIIGKGAINTTAYNIEVKPYEPPPPPTLKDFINPAVGDKFYKTENTFEQEWLTGGSQVYQKSGDTNKIVMTSRNKYKKVLQGEHPRKPESWYPQGDQEQQHQIGGQTLQQVNRGLHRWKKLPEPIDQRTDMVLLDPENDLLVNKDATEQASVMAPGVDPHFSKSPDPGSRREARNNTVLTMIVDDWRGKWHLDMRYADASPDDLIRDMADLHPNIRLKAITTCARAAEYRPPPAAGIQLKASQQPAETMKLLPERLFTALQCCLEDQHEHVRRAAAITLFTLERPCPEADIILRNTLKQQKSVDRWTAAQCLAYYGECDSEVVGELVSQLLDSEDKIRHEQAAHLLGRLSENSTLVHSMLGEQLNSSSWRHRVMVCRTFPKLYGHINKDLVNKLAQLMWKDWHSEVRKAAAQCLGKTGHGKEVHDELYEKMASSIERVRVEAVSKVGHLALMTAKLMPVFLQCFEDSYVSVRMEVCIACSNLHIKDEQVLNKLLHLATYDSIWKVKALAIQALGNIGLVTEKVRECVLWAVRYEDQEGVRAEACHAAIKLGLQDATLAQILQDRLLVESSPAVRQEIIAALESMGISPSEDMDMVTQIKSEVRKLCTRDNIAAQISANEKEAEKEANIDRMIVRDKKKVDTGKAEPAGRQSGSVSGRGQAPRVLVTPGSSRPSQSREGTRLTPIADEEVKAIVSRKDLKTPSSSNGHSREKSAKTVSTVTEGTEDWSEGDSDEETVSTSRSRSAVSKAADDDGIGVELEDETLTVTNLLTPVAPTRSRSRSRSQSGNSVARAKSVTTDLSEAELQRIVAHARLPPQLHLSGMPPHAQPDIVDILDFSQPPGERPATQPQDVTEGATIPVEADTGKSDSGLSREDATIPLQNENNKSGDKTMAEITEARLLQNETRQGDDNDVLASCITSDTIIPEQSEDISDAIDQQQQQKETTVVQEGESAVSCGKGNYEDETKTMLQAPTSLQGHMDLSQHPADDKAIIIQHLDKSCKDSFDSSADCDNLEADCRNNAKDACGDDGFTNDGNQMEEDSKDNNAASIMTEADGNRAASQSDGAIAQQSDK